MSDLDKAREWANGISYHPCSHEPEEVEAARIILNLPDQWIDAENVQAMIDNYKHARDSNAEGTEGWVINHLMVSNLESLIPTPKLPTLAELIKQGNDPEQYRWTQAKVFHTEELGCVTNFDLYGECATVLFPNGVAKSVPYEDITPLPDLPKLEWPGEIPRKPYLFGGTSNESDLPDMSVSERMERTGNSIKPEDVPPNEPWLIEANGTKAIGTRYKGDAVLPWFVAALDGSFADDYHDSVVTLIHKLVPEPPALPEGMRVADHEQYGRVITSPKPNRDGVYYLLVPRPNVETGADWDYAHECELTFLDGEA